VPTHSLLKLPGLYQCWAGRRHSRAPNVYDL
jgi:hypothetical protein